jgi:hypothetical protein
MAGPARMPPVALHEAASRRYSELRALGHHLPRAPRRARRPEARAAPHPLHDVARPAPPPDAKAPQERGHRRRRDGEVPPPRRPVDLRRHGAPRAALGLRAPHARRRAGQLRQPRRRCPRRRCATPRPSCGPWRWSCWRSSANTPSICAPTTTANSEPVVLPARFPHLLVNGCAGHRRGHGDEHPAAQPAARCSTPACCSSTIPRLPLEKRLCRKVRGPDFPTGGELLTPRSGAARDLRHRPRLGDCCEVRRVPERQGKKALLILTSIPYAVRTRRISSKDRRADLRSAPCPSSSTCATSRRRRAHACGARALKTRAPAAGMAYLYKHTPLQQRYHINLTCARPHGQREVCVPARLNLRDLLKHWLDLPPAHRAPPLRARAA